MEVNQIILPHLETKFFLYINVQIKHERVLALESLERRKPHRTAKKRIAVLCGSRLSEPHRTTVLLGIGTAGTTGI